MNSKKRFSLSSLVAPLVLGVGALGVGALFLTRKGFFGTNQINISRGSEGKSIPNLQSEMYHYPFHTIIVLKVFPDDSNTWTSRYFFIRPTRVLNASVTIIDDSGIF
jgi:hypothetical protein